MIIPACCLEILLNSGTRSAIFREWVSRYDWHEYLTRRLFYQSRNDARLIWFPRDLNHEYNDKKISRYFLRSCNNFVNDPPLRDNKETRRKYKIDTYWSPAKATRKQADSAKE